MNPILLKPGSDTHSQVIVRGRAVGEADALSYRDLKPTLRGAVLEALDDLRSRFDVVICEGAGSPAEINLRENDLTNMGLARAAALPTVVVGDIDRGGVFAALYGTLALLEPADQELIAGFVVNKFRGDEALLAPGLSMLSELTARPFFGVLPWRPGLWIDAEDSLAVSAGRDAAAAPYGRDALRIAVVALPRISNVTDLDALAAEPGVLVGLTASPTEIADADLVVVPGTRATVNDLRWLRDRGLAEVIADRARRGRPVVGICGGYQMLARTIDDEVESRRGAVDGLGLLPASVHFGPDKIVGRTVGSMWGEQVRGYEIHHGVVEVQGGEPFLDGCRSGVITGFTWHGVFDNDGFRRSFLREVATQAGRAFTPDPSTGFAALRERRLDAAGDLVADHLDVDRLLALAASAVPVAPPIDPAPLASAL